MFGPSRSVGSTFGVVHAKIYGKLPIFGPIEQYMSC